MVAIAEAKMLTGKVGWEDRILHHPERQAARDRMEIVLTCCLSFPTYGDPCVLPHLPLDFFCSSPYHASLVERRAHHQPNLCPATNMELKEVRSVCGAASGRLPYSPCLFLFSQAVRA